MCYVLLCVTVSILVNNHLNRQERESGLLCLVCPLVYHYCCVAVPHDAMGLATVCDCDIS